MAGLGYTAALEGFRVVGVDLRGHGRSGKPHRPRDYALATQADDLVAVLDAVDAPRAHVVGYSLGACIGFHLASRRPERVSAFVSLGGRFGALAGGADAIFSPDAVATLRTQGIDGFLNAWAAYRGAPVDSGTALAFSQNDPLALAALLGSLEGEPGLAPEYLAAITAPTLLLTGDRDAVGMRDAHEAERALPRATTTVVAGTDHAALLGVPAPLFVFVEAAFDDVATLVVLNVVTDRAAALRAAAGSVSLLVGGLGDDRDDAPVAQVPSDRAGRVRLVAANPDRAGAGSAGAAAGDTEVAHQNREHGCIAGLSGADQNDQRQPTPVDEVMDLRR